MSALFQLDYSGPQTACDFPGCRLDSFHDGDHLFDAPPKSALETANRKMEKARPDAATVTLTRAEWTALWMADPKHRRELMVPISCSCAQRPYPHELSVHTKLRSEKPGVYLDYYDWPIRFAEKGMRWPWSLCLSAREEFSAERKQSHA